MNKLNGVVKVTKEQLNTLIAQGFITIGEVTHYYDPYNVLYMTDETSTPNIDLDLTENVHEGSINYVALGDVCIINLYCNVTCIDEGGNQPWITLATLPDGITPVTETFGTVVSQHNAEEGANHAYPVRVYTSSSTGPGLIQLKTTTGQSLKGWILGSIVFFKPHT